MERGLSGLGFWSPTIRRPGLIGGQRRHRLLTEVVGSMVLGALAPVLPMRLQTTFLGEIAPGMVDVADMAAPDNWVIGPANLKQGSSRLHPATG